MSLSPAFLTCLHPLRCLSSAGSRRQNTYLVTLLQTVHLPPLTKSTNTHTHTHVFLTFSLSLPPARAPSRPSQSSQCTGPRSLGCGEPPRPSASHRVVCVCQCSSEDVPPSPSLARSTGPFPMPASILHSRPAKKFISFPDYT